MINSRSFNDDLHILRRVCGSEHDERECGGLGREGLERGGSERDGWECGGSEHGGLEHGELECGG